MSQKTKQNKLYTFHTFLCAYRLRARRRWAKSIRLDFGGVGPVAHSLALYVCLANSMPATIDDYGKGIIIIMMAVAIILKMAVVSIIINLR